MKTTEENVNPDTPRPEAKPRSKCFIHPPTIRGIRSCNEIEKMNRLFRYGSIDQLEFRGGESGLMAS
jgi:hypothetical protein